MAALALERLRRAVGGMTPAERPLELVALLGSFEGFVAAEADLRAAAAVLGRFPESSSGHDRWEAAAAASQELHRVSRLGWGSVGACRGHLHGCLHSTGLPLPPLAIIKFALPPTPLLVPAGRLLQCH